MKWLDYTKMIDMLDGLGIDYKIEDRYGGGKCIVFFDGLNMVRGDWGCWASFDFNSEDMFCGMYVSENHHDIKQYEDIWGIKE
jgi:hypothetical protein